MRNRITYQTRKGESTTIPKPANKAGKKATKKAATKPVTKENTDE